MVREWSQAKGSARAVLNVLASYADADGTSVFPGTATIIRDTGLSRSTIRRARRELEELGEIQIVAPGFGDRSTRYRLTLSPPVDEPVETRQVPNVTRVHRDPGEGSPRPRGRVHRDPLPVTHLSTPEGGRCRRHAGVADPPPCRGCQEAREAEAKRQADEDRRLAREQAREETRRAQLEATPSSEVARRVEQLRHAKRRDPVDRSTTDRL